ncbi:MAG: Trk system potassium transporter TrkA [Parasporobacterium sp.]|nr:Trk system potassium transporter TrkA [Parasporobacterium sp.]
MNIIIAGCGKIGSFLAEKLAADKHDVTVIDKNEANLNAVGNSLDVMTCTGDAANAEVMEEAGASDTDLLLAVTDSDEINLLVCLIGRKMGCKAAIARVRNHCYDSSQELIRKDLGIDRYINPDRATASEILRSLKYKSVGQVETFGGGRVELLTLQVKPGMPICNVQIKDLAKILSTKIFICAIKRDDFVFIPNGLTEIKAGDTISFGTNQRDTIRFFNEMKMDVGAITALTIIGASRLGEELALQAAEHGIAITFIDKDPENCRYIANRIPVADVILGDATDTDLLDEYGILKSQAVVTCTDEETINAVISMYVRKNAPECKVITKIKKSDFSDLVSNLDMGSIYNVKNITADIILKRVKAINNSNSDEIVSLTHIIDNKVMVLEFKITKDHPNRDIPLRSLNFKENLLAAAIIREGKNFMPGGNDVIKAEDTLLVVTTNEDIGAFKDIFEQ